MVKLAVVGLGLVGKRHVTAIQNSNGAQLLAIVETSETGTEDALGLQVECFKSLDDLFRFEKPDGVILSTPTPFHLDQALECINRRCPVMIEKPLAVSAGEGQKIVVAAAKMEVPTLVGHHRRYNPLVQKAHCLIGEGAVGDIRTVHANCWFYKPDDYFDAAPWRKLKGAGPILVNLVHDVDLLRYFCGEIIRVQAQARPSVRGYENEDVAAALLTFENGAVGTITVSDAVVSPWSWELTSGEYPIYPKTDESCYLIGGSKASLSVPDLKIWSHAEKPDWWSPISAVTVDHQQADPLINQIDHFADVIEGRAAPLVSAEEGQKTLRVIEAIQEAAAMGQAVELT